MLRSVILFQSPTYRMLLNMLIIVMMHRTVVSGLPLVLVLFIDALLSLLYNIHIYSLMFHYPNDAWHDTYSGLYNSTNNNIQYTQSKYSHQYSIVFCMIEELDPKRKVEDVRIFSWLYPENKEIFSNYFDQINIVLCSSLW